MKIIHSKAFHWLLSVILVLTLVLGQLPGDRIASAAVTKNVYSFGAGAKGQLGHNDTALRLTPTAISAFSSQNVTAISAGEDHTLALTADGNVYSFGNAGNGRLGHGADTADKTVPTLISYFDDNSIVATAVSAGQMHSLVLSSIGEVYAFGAGGSGRLGTGAAADVHTPVKIGGDLVGKQAIAISAGDAHSLVLTGDGSLYSFGAGSEGRLGHGDTSQQTTPKRIDALPAITAISAGGYHSLAVTVTGSVYSFGHGAFNQLGHNATGSLSIPTPIAGLASEQVTAVSAGLSYSLALTANGDVYSFGSEFVGQLGHGVNSSQPVPKKIEALAALDITAISVGRSHSVVLTDQGDVYAFGFGTEGQLGVGIATNTNLPLKVAANIKGSVIDAGNYYTIVIGEEDDGHTYSVAASVDEIAFYNKNVGYSPFAATAVTVTNNGTGPITGLSATTSSDFEVVAPPAVALAEPGASTTLHVRPVADLTPGTHTGTLTLSADRGVAATIDLSFEVTATPTYSVELTPAGDVTFPTSGLVYNSVGMVHDKYLTRTGTGDIHIQSIELLGGSDSSFYVGTLHATEPTILSDNGLTISFKVRPKENLPVGSYSDTVRITGDHGISVEFDAAFEVQGAPVIASHPLDVTVYASEDAAFSTSATGTGLTYQWQVDNGSGFANLPGKTSSTLSLEDVTSSMNDNQYRVIVSGTIAPAAISNAATLQVHPIPGAPANLAATAGNGQVSLTWDPTPGATGYNIYQSPSPGTEGSLIASVIGSEYTHNVTGLTNGMTYYFVVKATNPAGEGDASNQVSTRPILPEEGSSEASLAPSDVGEDLSAVVWVNGVAQNIGTVETTQEGDRTIATVSIDEEALKAKLAAEGQGAIVLVYSNAEANSFSVELTGHMMDMLSEQDVTLEVRTENAAYAIPIRLIDWTAITGSFQTGIPPQDIKLLIAVSKPSEQMTKLADDAASREHFEIVAPAVEFTISASYGDKTVSIDRFTKYVERRIAIPATINPSSITTGIVIEPNGSVWHVPTKTSHIDGQAFASVFSLTNSVYALVAHESAFVDVTNHWAKGAVNEMASRLILSGTDTETFAPNAEVTRAQFASVIARALGLRPGSGKETVFPDVQPSSGHLGDIQVTASFGLISGFEDGTFRPGDRMTREQMMSIVAKAMKLAGVSTSAAMEQTLVRFQDADQISGWAREAVAAVVAARISEGRSAVDLAPKASVTRAEAAVIVERLLRKANLIND